MGVDVPGVGHIGSLPFKIKPGAVVVFEGLDATGKTTQHNKIEQACLGMGHGPTPLFDIEPLFLHMPSAGTMLGQSIYEMTEAMRGELDDLSRQYLHLASHAQSVQTLIKPALKDGRPVFLDRWWWSTMAYGWFGSKRVRKAFKQPSDFYDMCSRTWRGVNADLICVFMHPHEEDRHNTPDIAKGYKMLADDYPISDKVVFIEPGHAGDQGEQIFDAMIKRDLYRSS